MSDLLSICCLSFINLTWCSAMAMATEDPIVLSATKDNSIVLVDNEWDVNAGGSPRISIKGNQHLVVLGFDTQALRGRRVRRATLVCQAADQALDGVTISTLASPWEEHTSTALTAGDPTVTDWGYPGAKFPAVCGGNGQTLTTDVRGPARDGRYEWEISRGYLSTRVLPWAIGRSR